MHSVGDLIKLALVEDIGPGDITTDTIVAENMRGRGVIVAKESLVVAGIDIAREVFEIIDPGISFSSEYNDGDPVEKGSVVLTVEGKLRALLKGERTALNFMQRLSGIATNVRSYVEEMEGLSARLVDTRKTIPGWRTLEKYAVRVGGAYNHRMALYDGVMLKDNHIAVCGGLKQAVARARENISHLIKIEVEVTCREELLEALDAKADVIMLDNMDLDQIRESVKLIDKRAIVEVSGSVTKKDLRKLAETGVDIISSGALTHQATAVDLSMRIG